jgi:hypothetical protein
MEQEPLRNLSYSSVTPKLLKFPEKSLEFVTRIFGQTGGHSGLLSSYMQSACAEKGPLGNVGDYRDAQSKY